MSEFTTPLVVKLIGKNKWSICQKFRYYIGEYPSDSIIEVPVGFVTNFASIPRIFWPLISPVDKHAKASVIHDFLYFYGLYSRRECDLIFKEALEVLSVKKWKIFCMYWAVRLFGWGSWLKHRRRRND